MSATASATTGRAAAISVESPVTRTITGHVPDMRAQVPALVQRARDAQPAWVASRFRRRAEVVASMRRWIVDNRRAIIDSTMRETGKTYEDAVANEVLVVADGLRFWERNAER